MWDAFTTLRGFGGVDTVVTCSATPREEVTSLHST
jgi:hypothetical protein